MHLTHLSLGNFRSYQTLDLELKEGAHIFIGENGEGKTNIVEAIMYLALLSSHRISSDAPLIRLGSNSATIRAKADHEGRSALIELEINDGKANRAKLNQNPLKTQRALLGMIKAICFSPEDLDIVRGDPNERRNLLDHLLVQRNPRLGGVIADYERTLKQRNALLKSRASDHSLHPWNEHLTNFGSEIIAARQSLISDLQPHLITSYESISKKKVPTIGYKSSIINPSIDKEENRISMSNKINEVLNQERERGVSLVGPHRDDLLLNLGEHPVKGFASHGESWSVALALRLASFNLLRTDGDSPILILDDVFSELDEARRSQLSELMSFAEQTFITVAVENDLPKNILGKKYLVKNQKVSEK